MLLVMLKNMVLGSVFWIVVINGLIEVVFILLLFCMFSSIMGVMLFCWLLFIFLWFVLVFELECLCVLVKEVCSLLIEGILILVNLNW